MGKRKARKSNQKTNKGKGSNNTENRDNSQNTSVSDVTRDEPCSSNNEPSSGNYTQENIVNEVPLEEPAPQYELLQEQAVTQVPNVDTSDTETASSFEVDRSDDGDAPVEFFEEIDNALCLNVAKLQQFRDALVSALEESERESGSTGNSTNSDGINRNNAPPPPQVIRIIRSGILHSRTSINNMRQIVTAAMEEEPSRPIQNVSPKKVPKKGTKKKNKSTIQSNEGQIDNSEGQSQSITIDQATSRFNIPTDMPREAIGVIEDTIIISRGAIPRTNITDNQLEESNTTQFPESRVPYITNVKDFLGPNVPSVAFKPILTQEKIFNEKVNSLVLNAYKLQCIDELTRPQPGYVSLLPGIFTLSLNVTHEDDFQLIKIIYPTLRYHPNFNYIRENCFLLEEKVLKYLENFRTNLLCRIFDSILRKKRDNFKFITESEYLEQMRYFFSYAHSESLSDADTYCAKENKSKYCPGRYSKIEKKFRKETFK